MDDDEEVRTSFSNFWKENI